MILDGCKSGHLHSIELMSNGSAMPVPLWVFGFVGNQVQTFLWPSRYAYNQAKMDRESTWGTEVEMITLAHLLNTPVVSYLTEHADWKLDISLDDDDQTQMSIYLRNNGAHLEVVFHTKVTACTTNHIFSIS